jgi:hypothetical protein
MRCADRSGGSINEVSLLGLVDGRPNIKGPVGVKPFILSINMRNDLQRISAISIYLKE